MKSKVYKMKFRILKYKILKKSVISRVNNKENYNNKLVNFRERNHNYWIEM